MAELNDNVLYRCLKCQNHTVLKNGYDGVKCVCGGTLIPKCNVYVGIDLSQTYDSASYGYIKC